VKVLHVLKTRPDELTEKFIGILSEGEESDFFRLYDDRTDYGAFLESVFSHDKVVSWW
jgi:hypothetical protein